MNLAGLAADVPRALAGGALLSALLLAACIDPTRVNTTCRWTDAVSGRLDLRRAQDREHLRQDAQVAWEVAQRYADVRYRTRGDLARPLLDSCRALLSDSIVARHGVAATDIQRATRARAWWIDVAAIFLPMMLLTAIGADAATRELRRSIERERVRAILLPILVGVVSLIATGTTQMWAMTVETWRLRDGHLAGRVFVLPSIVHPIIAFASLCIVASIIARRRTASLGTE